MENFLKRIGATEELIETLKKSFISAHMDTEKKQVLLSFKEAPKLSSKLATELFSKSNKVVNEEMNTIICSFDYPSIIGDDLLVSYDFLRQYLITYMPMINLAHLYVKSDEYSYTILTAREEVFTQINNSKNEIEFFLRAFGLTGLPIVVELNPDAFSEQKLNKILEESMTTKPEKKNTEIIDEKVRPGYSEIDFSVAIRKGQEKQTKVYFEGEVYEYERNVTKNDLVIHKFSLGNGPHAVRAILFDSQKSHRELSKGETIRIYGTYEFEDYGNEFVFKVYDPNYTSPKAKFNNAKFNKNKKNEEPYQKITSETLHNIKKEKIQEKRYEFHLHSKMSTLDGVSNVKDYIRYAEAYNVGAITVTDHNTAQAFPDAYYASKGTSVIVNYGVEFDVYDDLNTSIVINPRDEELLTAEYIFFDLETTSVSAWLSEIIEFGGVKYKDNKVIDRLQTFIKPDREISKFTTKLTSITNEDVADAPALKDALIKIKEWIGDSILVAHNASFDFNFLNNAFKVHGLGEIENPVIDTMKLSWFFHPKSRSHRLGVLAKNEFVVYDETAAHRADYDAEVLSKIFERMIHKLLDKDLRNLNQITNEVLNENKTWWHTLEEYYFTRHINVISKNQDGLKDINELVSLANVDHFNTRKKSPMLPLSMFTNKEERLLKNVLIGSSCTNGVLFDAILNAQWDVVDALVGIYDYLEIFPPSAYKHLINNHIISWTELKTVLRKIREIGIKNNIPVIVTSNAHYTNPEEKEFRDILITAKRVGGVGHPLNNYKNPTIEKPDNHLRTTTEIFEEFDGWFNEDEIYEMTITNTKLIQDCIEKQKPIKDELYAPKIPGAEDKLKESIRDKIAELYGANPNPIITERVERELQPILDHGFGIIYYLSAVAVKKSNEDGYLVGSRGSVGSSLAATFSGITDVNPLTPHYRCPHCKHHEFTDDVDDGFDLDDKNCPVCQTKMIGDGHKIPFETFLGFNADKVPDIDLNFSRDNQSSIHLYMKEFLGEKNVFRAGTISTAAFKTAIGYVRNYEEITEKNINKTSVEWLARKIEGAKRTTGQHPGGLIVIPDDMSVYDFTPINYPGDDFEADWKTTHFDFHSIHDNLLKLDFLGHLDPSSVRMLQTLTNVDPATIPMNDKEVISLFTSNDALKYQENYTNEKLGVLGIPEFGTFFVRNLLRNAKPQTFADLVRISGLSHGTDVWANNAEDLIKKGTATLSEVISVRDDIMTYLIEQGLDKSMSFDIMESVRKGKGLTPEWEHSMRENNVPDWYIESSKKIKYMFPKAHATAYVMMAFRIAWYKINYPLEYYATYFSKRDIELDLNIVLKGIDEMQKHYAEIQSIPRNEKTKKDEDLLDTYMIVFEMYSRGIKFKNIDIQRSRSGNFEIDKETNSLIPPFSILPGVGKAVAETTTDNRRKKPFTTKEDFINRCGLPKKIIELLSDLKVFDNVLTEKETTQQLSLFE